MCLLGPRDERHGQQWWLSQFHSRYPPPSWLSTKAQQATSSWRGSVLSSKVWFSACRIFLLVLFFLITFGNCYLCYNQNSLNLFSSESSLTQLTIIYKFSPFKLLAVSTSWLNLDCYYLTSFYTDRTTVLFKAVMCPDPRRMLALWASLYLEITMCHSSNQWDVNQSLLKPWEDFYLVNNEKL